MTTLRFPADRLAFAVVAALAGRDHVRDVVFAPVPDRHHVVLVLPGEQFAVGALPAVEADDLGPAIGIDVARGLCLAAHGAEETASADPCATLNAGCSITPRRDLAFACQRCRRRG